MQRHLTGGEIDLLKGIYGSTINYDLVLVESRSSDSILGSATSYGNLITIPANGYFDDYSNISPTKGPGSNRVKFERKMGKRMANEPALFY